MGGSPPRCDAARDSANREGASTMSGSYRPGGSGRSDWPDERPRRSLPRRDERGDGYAEPGAGNDSRDDGYGQSLPGPSSSGRRSPQRDAYDTYGNGGSSYNAPGYGQPRQNWQGGYGQGGWDDAAGMYGANNSDQRWAASPWRDDAPRGRRAASPAPAAPPARRSRKRVWVALLIVVLLLSLG